MFHVGSKILAQWIETVKNLNDSDRNSQAHATTPKQDQQIVSLAEEQIFATSRDVTTGNQSRSKREECSEAAATYNRPLSKALLTENRRMNRFK